MRLIALRRARRARRRSAIAIGGFMLGFRLGLRLGLRTGRKMAHGMTWGRWGQGAMGCDGLSHGSWMAIFARHAMPGGDG